MYVRWWVFLIVSNILLLCFWKWLTKDLSLNDIDRDTTAWN